MIKYLCFICIAFPLFTYSQDSTTYNVTIRSNAAALKTPYKVTKIDMTSPNSLAFGNLSDAIEKSGQAFVQKSQGGGGSIVLRGFEASRILMVIDGVRTNNAIYRAGHLQNAVTVNPNSVQSIALLPGSHGTAFGSDALGGVVSVTTKTIMPTLQNKQNKTSGQVKLNFATATQEWRPNVDLSIATKNWANYTNISYSKFGAITQGAKRTNAFPDFGKVHNDYAFINNTDSFVVNNTVNKQKAANFTQVDLLQKIVYQKSKNAWHTFNIQYSNSSNIPRTDRLQERTGAGLPVHAAWYYGPQKRFLTSHNYYTKIKGWFNDLQSIMAYQKLEESRYNRRYRNYILQERIEKINVLSFSLDLNKKTNKGNFNTGIDMQYNAVKSNAQGRNVLTQAITAINTRYPNGANHVFNIGLFGIYKYNITQNLKGEAGIRANYNYLKSTFLSNPIFPVPFNNAIQNIVAPSGHIALMYTKATFKGSIIYSNGFRAPNIDDLAKVFESVAGILIVPNNNLKPEYTQSFETNFTVAKNNFTWDAGLYYTKLNKFISTKPGLYNGQPTFNYLGVTSTILTNINFDKGFIMGYQSALNYKMTINKTAQILLGASYTFTYGRLINTVNTKTPLDHIPPAFGKLFATFKTAKMQASIFLIGNSKKTLASYRLAAEDNEVYATANGTLGWHTWNLEGFYNITKKITLKYGITNILDKNYRLFASGISAPGLNVVGGFMVGF